ncbi:6283_t:CDS:1 [Ambispora gerdemannii]|uniref:6283_t:CDS:1 n=1 Tax=Ambispora gerdemannii TaxID=144530 RepID=A0A9N8VYR6_9GLOM|nr:6283_t:CDS:1 [Ambispora gerdemannii]
MILKDEQYRLVEEPLSIISPTTTINSLSTKNKNPVILEDEQYRLMEEPLSMISPTTTARTSPAPQSSRAPSRANSRSRSSSLAPSRPASRASTLGPNRLTTAELLARPGSPNDDVHQLKELAQRKNLIYIGIPAIVDVPSTRLKETTRGVFHIYNPTQNSISWSLTPKSAVYYKRVESKSNTLGQKVNDEVFIVMKQRGFLKSGQSERVYINYTPLAVGIYTQKFALGESETADIGEGETVELQIEGAGWPAATQRKDSIKKEIKFEVSEKEIRIPMTRIGKQRTLGIKIENPTKETIRLKCKCEVIGATLLGPPVLSIPLSSLTIKSGATVTLPICFHPRKRGTIKGLVTVSSPLSKTEVKVDVTAQAVSANYRDGAGTGSIGSGIELTRSMSSMSGYSVAPSEAGGSSVYGEESGIKGDEILNAMMKSIHELSESDSNNSEQSSSLIGDVEKIEDKEKLGESSNTNSESVENTTIDTTITSETSTTNVLEDDPSSNGSTDTTRVEESTNSS